KAQRYTRQSGVGIMRCRDLRKLQHRDALGNWRGRATSETQCSRARAHVRGQFHLFSGCMQPIYKGFCESKVLEMQWLHKFASFASRRVKVVYTNGGRAFGKLAGSLRQSSWSLCK